jgi:NRPS condensation-like uncharacterized protein
MYEDIAPALLQTALEQTVDDFPLYKSVLRRGLFWYYLESSDIKPQVQIESTTVCAPIYVGLRYHLLFRVSYFRKRINLEVFHALSDGAGALRFLQTLVYRYMLLKDSKTFQKMVMTTDDASVRGLMDDSFDRHFAGGGQKGKLNRKDTKAYHIPGTKSADNRMNLVEGAMSAMAVLCEAHKNNTTLTVYLTSLYMLAISKEMRAGAKKYPVVLTVPVNLRQYFESVTARNFFSYINIGCRFDSGTEDLETVIQCVSALFKEDLTLEQLNYRSNSYMSVERNLFTRIVPLPAKDLVARIIVNKAIWQTTSTISNIGIISMPAEFQQVIRQFSVCTSAQRPQMTLCSYGDRLVVSITSPHTETDIQRTFFQMLAKLGVDVVISSTI